MRKRRTTPKRRANNEGCVAFLGENSTRPYAARITLHDKNGNTLKDEKGRARRKDIGYAETPEEAQNIFETYLQGPRMFDNKRIVKMKQVLVNIQNYDEYEVQDYPLTKHEAAIVMDALNECVARRCRQEETNG